MAAFLKLKQLKQFSLLMVIVSLFMACGSDDEPIVPEPEPEPDYILVTSTSELLEALQSVEPGDSIRVESGNYVINNRLTLSVSGTESNPIRLVAVSTTNRPVFDFSNMAESSSNQGIVLDADYWRIYGIDFFKAGDNGMRIAGNNNHIEFCSFHECSDTGLQLDNGAANNMILNCDSYFNADSSIENADGFASKLNVGSGNHFEGCRAWQNLDDGWDGYLRNADNVTTTYKNCWAIKNGYLKDGSVSGGDGNGFKTGGSDNKDLKHNAEYQFCLSVGNGFDGFDHNSNRGRITIINCSAYNNGKNYNFGTTNPAGNLTIINSASLGTNGSLFGSTNSILNNSWQNGLSCTNADFESLEIAQLLAPRKANGDLPDVSFMHLVSSSDLIDAGRDQGFAFNGNAPDIGAFEF